MCKAHDACATESAHAVRHRHIAAIRHRRITMSPQPLFLMPAACDSHEEAFLWPDAALKRLIEGGWNLPDIGRCLRRLSLSTAFSGVDAPGVSATMLCKRYAQMTGDAIRVRHLAAIE
eukprot:1959572-Lingulodinium_polyedra.AAC.1